MYGLLKVRNFHLVNAKPVDNLVQNFYLCSFCKFYHQQTLKFLKCQQLKNYSTTAKISEISIPIPKKIKRKSGKFLEILEVTEAAATNRRTKVKKLNAENLSKFVEPNNVEMEKIKDKNVAKKKFKQKDISKVIEEIKLFTNQKKSKVEEGKTKNSKPVVEEKVMKTEKTSSTVDNYLEAKQSNLYSFFQTCINCGKGKQALNLLLHFEKSSQPQRQIHFKNVKFYNLFFRYLASMGDFKNVLLLKNLMKKHSILMNAESYAFIFECLARSDNTKKLEFLKTIKTEMIENNISLNSIVTSPLFVKDQLEKILEMIKLLDENFTPHFQLKTIKYNNHLLDNIFNERNYESPAKNLFKLDDLKARAKKQFDIESIGEVEIQSIDKQLEPTKKILQNKEELNELHEKWRIDISNAFKRNLSTLKLREKDLRISDLNPYLTVFEPEIYVNAILREVKILIQSTESFSQPITYLAKDLALSIFKKYEYKIQHEEKLHDNILKCYEDYCKWFLYNGNAENGRIKWLHLEYQLKKEGQCSHYPILQWPSDVLKEVGRFLYDIILKDLKVNITMRDGNKIAVPAFYVIFRSKFKVMKEEIQPHPLLTKMNQGCNTGKLKFSYDTLPSLSPPRPWFSIDRGGYLINKTSIIRLPFSFAEHFNLIKSKPKEQIYPLLDSLNQLGSIPWRVNTAILDIAMKVFQNGGSKELNVPESPSILPDPPVNNKLTSEKERRENAKNAASLRKKKNEMHSLWCDALYKLSLANHYKDEIFWLPHNMDFRGRVYPIPPHLSHIGSDFSRSMLVFALKKPLGPKGLDWLKIHTINLTGFKKKESIKNRLLYANEILDKILDSANNPLTGEMWWTTSDEPWQTLAACMEISKALMSPNPSKYMTGFPVHQDGSCNGLQHYAALGRDQIGAESVNLFPFETPRDVYSDIVVRVEEARRLDAEKNVEIAKILKDFIERKVIKQTIMTTVYGVTRYGAKLQILKQLKDLDNFPEDKIQEASSYLADQTFHCLRTMFTSAREIQDWFTECARLICTFRGAPVEWETPLGLPVLQPYIKFDAKITKSPNTLKQKNAFPPNFIHSLDSTHMMLTSLYSEQAGISFMSVHDCFWTHPSTVTKMNEICRKQFIALHSEPILENLSEYMLNKFKYSKEEIKNCKLSRFVKNYENFNKVLAQVPPKGKYDIKNVELSTYFFS